MTRGFTSRAVVEAGAEAAEAARQKTPRYVPNAGFLLFEGDGGQIYMRLFTHVRPIAAWGASCIP